MPRSFFLSTHSRLSDCSTGGRLQSHIITGEKGRHISESSFSSVRAKGVCRYCDNFTSGGRKCHLLVHTSSAVGSESHRSLMAFSTLAITGPGRNNMPAISTVWKKKKCCTEKSPTAINKQEIIRADGHPSCLINVLSLVLCQHPVMMTCHSSLFCAL